MRVTSEFLNIVAFVCRPGVAPPMATAFLVNVDHDNVKFLYFVTARHVVERLQDEILLRVNSADGDSVSIPTHRDDWCVSTNADVAAYLYRGDANLEKVLISSVPLENFVNEHGVFKPKGVEIRGPFNAEVGFEVFVTGLFSVTGGLTLSRPVARFGHIAHLPTSVRMVRSPGWAKSPPEFFHARVYLVEARSFGGQSGSPCFVTFEYLLSKEIEENGEKHVIIVQSWAVALLGLVSGHIDADVRVEGRGAADVGEGQPAEIQDFMVRQNAGMALVTPAAEVLSLLERSDVAEDRALRALEFQQDRAT